MTEEQQRELAKVIEELVVTLERWGKNPVKALTEFHYNVLEAFIQSRMNWRTRKLRKLRVWLEYHRWFWLYGLCDIGGWISMLCGEPACLEALRREELSRVTGKHDEADEDEFEDTP